MDNDIIGEYNWLIVNLANNFYGVPKEDLIQAGYLGLLKAKKNYHPNSQVKFSSYAYNYIRGEMYEVATHGRIMYINKDAMRVYKRMKRAQELLEQKYERKVSMHEVADFLHISEVLLLDILNSLSESLNLEMVALNMGASPTTDDKILISESLKRLSSIERKVIKRRYLEDYSQHETARILGLSQAKVSRIEKISREKMRKYIAS